MSTFRKLIIVGSGPSGLTAAIYAARANLKPLLLMGEISDYTLPGGQLMYTGGVDNYPGFPDGISGPDLMENMILQCKKHNVEFIDDKASEIILSSRESNHFIKVGDQFFETEAVILCMGASPRWLGVPGEQNFKNRGISSCAHCDGFAGRNYDVAVVGGGDSACEDALYLSNLSETHKVLLIVRSDKLAASEFLKDKVIRTNNIEIYWNNEVIEFMGDKRLEAIKINNKITGDQEVKIVSQAFVAIGRDPATQLVENSGLLLDDDGYVVINEKDNSTNILGVYAAGDIHDKSFKQAITSAGYGCRAAISAEKYLNDIKILTQSFGSNLFLDEDE